MRFDIPKNSCRNISTTTNGDHKIRVNGAQNLVGGSLTKLMHLDGSNRLECMCYQGRRMACGMRHTAKGPVIIEKDSIPGCK